jgi:hypothetical protein
MYLSHLIENTEEFGRMGRKEFVFLQASTLNHFSMLAFYQFSPCRHTDRHAGQRVGQLMLFNEDHIYKSALMHVLKT